MNYKSLHFQELTNFVKKIKYGYIDKDGEQHLGYFHNPDDNYKLQHPSVIFNNNIGLCFDIVEVYRNYFYNKNIYCESYYMEYSCGDVLESHAFIIFQKKNNYWQECVDNSWDGNFIPKVYKDKDVLIKSIYEWFQDYIESIYGQVDKLNFYFNKYYFPKNVYSNKCSLRTFCKEREYNGSFRVEFSGMSIVFCKQKVLILETKHNEFVFPKGHIESGESSKDASIRECMEESGVNLKDAKYIGYCGEYSYTFSGGHLKITNDHYYHTFGVSQITKTIYVHVYEINNFQGFTLENIFINGYWISINEVNKTISHENTLELFNKALELYEKNR